MNLKSSVRQAQTRRDDAEPFGSEPFGLELRSSTPKLKLEEVERLRTELFVEASSVRQAQAVRGSEKPSGSRRDDAEFVEASKL
ncbi:MAG: hypothetical protein COT34_02220 [Candidatus Nealsonbacteria bacterium CG08_land_8_20_14_0_20_43_11]|uniref:Uncharacterized protein n=1 Tax=Candidatus Nealsonbacteria bacterium CG08_land_8_20_14_0_20_43_11 TaxID=1974706 RepID=A0A2M6T060_9BACT|nr:MAG: hypothetical protein COT34_02220 [Candidatus Nealsonbacteria bacterium CG08_land_8_20_14_0_20_43_11]